MKSPDYDEIPHANVPLERLVLGQILAFPRCFGQYSAAGLLSVDFRQLVHRGVFDAVEALDASDAAIDEMAVSRELKRRGLLEEVGPTYLSRLTAEVVPPHEKAVAANVAELSQLAARRDVYQAAQRGDDLEDISSRIEHALSRGADDARIYPAAAQLRTIREDVARDKAGRVWLGFPTLDNTIGGARPGEVLGIQARPGIGKTLLLCHVTRYVAESTYGHVLFSLEMPGAQIVERLASSHYELGRHALRERLDAGVLDTEDYERTFSRFVLVDTPGLSVAQMATKLRQIQAGPLRGIPIRLVTIDHLGLIGGDRRMNTYDRVSTQARELKELAKRFSTTVYVAIQVNREAGGDGSKELGLGAARDSGVVEEALDYLVSMRRLDRSQTLSAVERERYRDVLFCKVVKNRHGAPDREVAIRIDPVTLGLREDATLQVTDDDLSRIAANAGRRR